MTDTQWQDQSGVAYHDHEGRLYSIRVDTAWALLRFFRTGEDWGSEEVKRQWAKEELEAFLARERVRLFAKPFKPRLA
jgi:hypothetical protein